MKIYLIWFFSLATCIPPGKDELLPQDISSLKYTDSKYVPGKSERKLDGYVSNEKTEKMIKFNSDYVRVLKSLGFEDDGKTLEQINQHMLSKFGKNGVKALLIATGSTGDVLPVAQYVKHIGQKLPWLDVSRAALMTTPNAREQVKAWGFNVEEFMFETSKDLVRPKLKWYPKVNRHLNPSIYAINADNYNSMNRCLRDAQVVFMHNLHGILYSDDSPLIERSKGNRIFIDVTPTNELDDGFTSVTSLREHRLDPTEPAFFYEYNRPQIYAKSSNFVTKYLSWKDSIEVGPFRMDTDPSFYPPTDLVNFLQQNKGKKIIYFGLGSMSSFNSDTHVVIEAQRGFCESMRQLNTNEYAFIWQEGIGDIEEATKTLFKQWNCPDYAFHLRKYVPHTWLFPRVDLAVHHGGSGTTHEALYAGVPSVICPVLNHVKTQNSDQPLFSKIINAFGYGIGLDYCNESNMPNAIRIAASDETIQKIVKEGQKRMQEEVEKDVGSILVAKYLAALETTLSQGVNVKQRESRSACLHYFESFHLRTLSGKYCSLSQNSGFTCNSPEKPEKPTFQLHHLFGLDNHIEVPISGSGYLATRDNTGPTVEEETSTYLTPDNGKFIPKTPQPHPDADDDSLEFIIDMKDNEYDHCIRNQDQISFKTYENTLTVGTDTKFVIDFQIKE